jgi:alkanesulfonate monooxygenase SsuD/methylene tetrahydromethanopterin reductase-like flavin-dependent oxidoreductase (luciferase family)
LRSVARRAIYLAPFDECADPRRLADLAARAEARGWDGFFLWDHVAYQAPVQAVADPWVALAAIACATSSLRLGALVTPLSRRRVQKLARETVTLEHLSGGRLVFGAGLGVENNNELEPYGEVVDPRARSRLLDQGLEQLAAFWAGGFQPRPLQQPRIPVWVAGRWPKRRPLQRAARWDGFFPIDLSGPDQLEAATGDLQELRAGNLRNFDLVVSTDPQDDPERWAAAGATWVLTGFGSQPRHAEVLDRIELGP